MDCTGTLTQSLVGLVETCVGGLRLVQRRPAQEVTCSQGWRPAADGTPGCRGKQREPRTLGRKLGPSGPTVRGGPLLEDGVTRFPLKREASGRIFQECTVAVKGHYYKLYKAVVEPYN